MESFLTVSQTAKHLSNHFDCDIPDWKMRRVIDGIDAEIPRAGQYRLVPRAALNELAATLTKWVEQHRGTENSDRLRQIVADERNHIQRKD